MNKFIVLIMTCSLLMTGFSSNSVLEVSAKSANETIINVTDYGADPSGKNDSAKAVEEALEAVKEHQDKAVRLVFEPGTYKITKENSQVREIHTSNTDSVKFPEKTIGVLIENQTNLTIDGQGSQLLFEGNMMALAILESENIHVENLKWDFQIPTTSEMTVYDYNDTQKTVDYFIPAYLDYEIQGNGILWKSEKNSEGNLYWSERNAHRNYGVQIKYPDKMMGRSYYSSTNPFQNAQSIETLENGLVRIKYSAFPIENVLGMNYQLLSNAERQTAGAFVYESKDVYFDNVQISYMHGFGFLIQMAENVYFNKLRMETDIATGKNTSSFADGIHVSGAKGKIEITNSFFNNTHDDPINIHGTFTRAEKIVNENTVQLDYIHAQQGGFQQYHPGDKVVFYSRDTLETSGEEVEYTVKSVKGPHKGNLKSMIVEFEEKIPSYLTEKIGTQPKWVAENTTYTPEILIKNNEFKNVFTRMILVTSRKKVVIEDNIFDAPSMPTLFFSNDSDEWYESGPIRDLEIRNNTFKIRSLGRTWWKYAPAIYFHPVTRGGNFPSAENPIHKNILIEENTFYLESDGALRAESVENLTFRNNKILRLEPEINLSLEFNRKVGINENLKTKLDKDGNTVEGLSSLPNGPEKNSGSVANVLEFQNSKNVIIENNTYDDGLKKNVLIEGMDESKYEIKDDLKVLTKREKGKASDPVSEVYYVSTNPEVASIDSKGTISTHTAGSTEIYAYTLWDETLITSNKETLTVEDSDSKERIKLSETVINVEENGSLKLQDDKNSLINIEDFTAHLSTDEFIKLYGSKLEVLASGVTKVYLENDTHYMEVVLVTNHQASNLAINSIISVDNQDNNVSFDEDKLTIVRQGNNDLWNNDNTLKNLVKFDVPKSYGLNYTMQVTLEGLPLRQANGSWDSSYLLLMKNNQGKADMDNYISVGKRAHADGVGMVQEINQKGAERNKVVNPETSNSTTMTVVIERIENNANVYLLENSTYHLLESFDIKHIGDDAVFAVGGWGNTQSNKTLTVKDVIITEGDHTSLQAKEALKIMEEDTNDYTATDVVIANKGNNYSISGSNLAGVKVILEDEVQNLSVISGNEFEIVQSGEYLIHIINIAKSQKHGNKVTKSLSVETIISDQIFVNGKVLEDKMTLSIPSDLNMISILNKDEHKVLNIEGKDEVIIEGKQVILKRMKSSDVSIESIETNYRSLDLSSSDSFIQTYEALNEMTMNIKASKSSKIIVDNEDHGIVYPIDENGKVSVPLYNGVASVRVRAFAEDGQTVDIHRVHVLRYNKPRLDQIKMSLMGESIEEEILDLKGEHTLKDLKVETPLNTKVTFHKDVNKNNTRVNGESIIIRVEHEDKRTVEFKTLTVLNEKVTKEVDKTILKKLVSDSKLIDKTLYTEESASLFTQALNNALEILNDERIGQEEVNQAVASLELSIKGLQEIEQITLNTERLEALIETVKGLDKGKYTEGSFVNLSVLFLKAQDLLLESDLTQDQINKMSDDLQLHIGKLVLKDENIEEESSLNKKQLESLIEIVNGLDKNKYTEESITVLTSTLDKAQQLLLNSNLTQEDIDDMSEELNTQIGNLVLKLIEMDKDEVKNPSAPTGLKSNSVYYILALIVAVLGLFILNKKRIKK